MDTWEIESLSVPDTPFFTRIRSCHCDKMLADLRQFYGDFAVSQLLGIKLFALGFKKRPVPVNRLITLLHFNTFHPGAKVTMFDLLTAGRYSRTLSCGAVPEENLPEHLQELVGIDVNCLK